jgi:16S rRNA (uracil1498-N3)-methyltransferase
VGLPDRDAFEKTLQSLVPFGVWSITPVECRYCRKNWWAVKWSKHQSRFNRIIEASVKQCLTPFVPSLNEVVRFKQAVEKALENVVYADIRGENLMRLQLHEKANEDISCFVGPPGGFAPEELDALKSKNSKALWLSPYRLRTELSASALASSIIQLAGNGKGIS